MLTASGDRTAKLWNPETGECLRTLEGHRDYVSSAALSPNGALAITASEDRTAKLWSVSSGECLCTFKGHRNYVWSAAVSF